MRTLIATLILVLATACVSSGTHKALQDDYTDSQRDLNETRETLRTTASRADSLDRQLQDATQREAALKKQSRSLEAALAQEKDEAKVLRDMLVEAEAKLASTIKDKRSLKASVDEMQAALKQLRARKAASDARIAAFQDLLGRFKSLIDAGKLRVKIVDGRMVVELATDVLFSSGSAQLSKDGKTAIAEVAAVLKDIEGRQFQVEGHTDDVPIRTKQYPSNWHLAAARALTVVETMVKEGMPDARLSAASYGQNRPVELNKTKDGKAANRRIEIVVVPDLSTLPGFEELKAVGAS